MKIYVASSWRNELQPTVVATLRESGHEVYDFRNPREGDCGFAWSDIDKNWQDWTPEQYAKAMKHPIAEAGFKSDFDAMKWADCCVMVLPCGRSANTEAGWMKGNGKQVFVYQPMKQEPELMYKIYDGIITSLSDLKQFAMAKNTLVYVLELNGTKAIYFDIDALCDSIKYEFEDIVDSDAVNMEFKVYGKLITEKQIEKLGEFDGF